MFSAGSAQAVESPASLRAAVDRAIAKMQPALVRIHVVSTEYREGRELKMQEVGSGAIISKDGYLVTNHHVAGHGARMVCTLWNREEVDAELVGTDPLTDISVLKLKPKKSREFAFATFGDSSKLAVGDTVLAMGSPMALSQSVTLGILSNLEMIMPKFFGPIGRFRLDGEDVGTLVRWIGHDAAIYPGNSGGPLVNLQGDIIGINEISFGLSGAIPGNLAKSSVEGLISHGKIVRGWLGMDVQPLFKHTEGTKGVLVSSVLEGSPAAVGGLRTGDLIIQLSGWPVDVHYDEQMPDFMRLVTSLPIGKEVTMVAMRDGNELTMQMRPVERGEIYPKQQELKQWGLTVRNLSFLAAKEMKRTNNEGVLVTSVRPGGPAGEAKPAISDHDVIVEVNSKPIKNAAELIEFTAGETRGKTEPTPVVATFERKAQRFMTVVKIGVEELRDPGLEVTKAWLPVEMHVISREIAKQLGKPDLKGFYVTQVYPKTTAEKAGLKPGDFIVALDGEKLTASGPEHEEELTTLIRQYDIGAKAELTVLRGSEQMKIPVELARSPKLQREMKKYRNEKFEFTTRNISFFDIAEEQWPLDQKGALVEDVKPGSWAELGTLYADDLILEAGGEPVTDVESLKKIMDKAEKDRKASLIMKVRRGIHTPYLEMEPAWEKPAAKN